MAAVAPGKPGACAPHGWDHSANSAVIGKKAGRKHRWAAHDGPTTGATTTGETTTNDAGRATNPLRAALATWLGAARLATPAARRMLR